MNVENFRSENRKRILLLALKAAHYLICLVIFYLFWMLFRYGNLRINAFRSTIRGYRYNYYVLIGYALLFLFFNRTYNSYLLGYSRIRELIFAQFLSQLFSAAAIYIMVSLGWDRFINPGPFILMLVIQMVLDVIWSYYSTWGYFQLYSPRRTILIYRNSLDRKRFGSIKGKPSERLYKIVRELRYEGRRFEEIRPILDEYDAIFVAGVDSHCRNGIVKYCKEENKKGFFLPHVGDVIMQEALHIRSFDSPVLYVSRSSLRPEYSLVKRLFDIIASMCGIILLSPIMAITAIAIKAYDGGPALYKQVRLTLDGKEFKILKFRSMRVDAEKDGVARLSSGDKDDRITPIGRIVRKCRLDQLPQLFNILKGDMSVVGPRPERPEIAEQYYQTIPAFKLRLQVKAGLTGYAQVYGKYNTDPYEKLEFDLLYISNMGIITDLQLIFATIAILFSSDSTEGVSAAAVTALDYEEEEMN